MPWAINPRAGAPGPIHGLNRVAVPCVSEMFQKLGTPELRNHHEDDGKAGVALECSRGRLAEQAIARKDALEARVSCRLYQGSIA